MTTWPPSDADLVALAAKATYAELARRLQKSVHAIEYHVKKARARLILPHRQQGTRKLRTCLYCGALHDSDGPGDRYHPNCRHSVTALDTGRFVG